MLSKNVLLKWRIFSQSGKIGTDKNTKYLFFLLGLKYTLRTCFEPKNFLSHSSPELSNQAMGAQFLAEQLTHFSTMGEAHSPHPVLRAPLGFSDLALALSGTQFFSLSNLLIVSKSGPATSI